MRLAAEIWLVTRAKIREDSRQAFADMAAQGLVPSWSPGGLYVL